MTLCVQALGPEGTETLQTVPLGPPQRAGGCNLHLAERTSAARQAIAVAAGCVKVAEALGEANQKE